MQKCYRLIFSPKDPMKMGPCLETDKIWFDLNTIRTEICQKKSLWHIFTYNGVFPVLKCMFRIKCAWLSLILHFHTVLVYIISLWHKISSTYGRWKFSFSNTRSWLLCVIRSFSTLIVQTFENHRIYTISKTFCY